MPRESGAIDYGQKLKSRGIPTEQIHIVSRRHGFAPPPKLRHPPQGGMFWCPYCLKWRNFIEKSIKRDGLRGPLLWRCPICTVSVKDAKVRQYNLVMVEKLEARAQVKKLATAQKIKKRLAYGRK